MWNYGIMWVCKTGNSTSASSRYAKTGTPIEIITGHTPDITEYLDLPSITGSHSRATQASILQK